MLFDEISLNMQISTFFGCDGTFSWGSTSMNDVTLVQISQCYEKQLKAVLEKLFREPVLGKEI